MTELFLRMTDGTHIVVPSSLNAMTTYVILEQEKWFEKETELLAHWLKPGMTVIDIGANLGAYSLPMARLVGPDGNVYAYEPASETRRMLGLSKTRNHADNLHIVGAALSDGERTGHLVLGASSELNSLNGSGPGESVPITSLDAENKAKGWQTIDFLKIDAEGEERRILAGAQSFFARHSPLVMFEINAGEKANLDLYATFVAMGFVIYRQLNGAPILVPMGADEPIDSYELNLFAAKADRAASLASAGMLVEAKARWIPDDGTSAAAFDLLKSQIFAPAIAPLLDSPIDPDYRNALGAYAAWRSAGRPVSERWAALEFACDTLAALCDREPSLPRLSTLARVMWEAGHRARSVEALNTFIDIFESGTGRVTEPFWPASPRFDSVSPQGSGQEWSRRRCLNNMN